MNFDIDLAISVLARTPAMLQSLLRGLDDRWTRTDEGPDTFSAFDNVGHLIDGEETDWIARAQIILAQGTDRRFKPFDRLRHKARNAGRTLESLLDEFAMLRAENISLMRSWNLTPEQLELRGIHPKFGEVTLRQLLATWVVHDLGHIAQISRVMAKQYKEAVGPWVEFVPVLTDHERPRS
jgi:DinB family protein